MDNTKLVQEHVKEKDESHDFKERRFSQWNENYLLYRDKINTNRLTQRQAINIPIMRETIQTWISKIDEPPELKFKARRKSKKSESAEIMVDSMWEYYYDKLALDILDNVDKKVVGLQGRSFKICGMDRGDFFIDIIDPYDVEISPRANMLDLNSAQYIIRTHIFKPLRAVLANKSYTQDGKNELKLYLDSKDGIIKAAETREAYTEKMDRLRLLGADNFDDFNASETLVEINESYKLIWNKEENRFVRHLIVIAADKVVLYNKPLEDAIGINRLPIVTWADDPDLNDPWCDGKGDSVRTINKVVNMYISQDVENRAYRNFGMYFFNTMNGTFQPRSFDPKPFGMFGVPGNPNEVLKQVDIPVLNDTTQQIGFLKNMIQSSVAQTPTERGEQTKSRTTFGEIELNLAQSQGRNALSSKHYRKAWKEIGELFYELMKANRTMPITLYKKGGNGQMYKADVFPSDWMEPEGFECEVVMKSEKDALDQTSIQKVQYTIQNFQDNPAALKIAKRKQLEILGWSTEEIEEAMQFEDQKIGGPSQEETPEVAGQANGRPFTNQQVLQQETQI